MVARGVFLLVHGEVGIEIESTNLFSSLTGEAALAQHLLLSNIYFVSAIKCLNDTQARITATVMEKMKQNS